MSKTIKPLKFLICIGLLLSGLALARAEPANVAVLLDVKGPIGPATSDYVVRGLNEAAERNAVVAIIRMDTPGGLDTSMREIIQGILSSAVPVVTYVAPSGARAASAGTYISYASHVAAMAPGTNLGAATPIQIGGPSFPSPSPGPDPGESDNEKGAGSGKDSDKGGDKAEAKRSSHPGLSDKAISDAVAYIRSLAQLRGRNSEWAEKAVREAASLAALDALEANVVDMVADDLNALLAQLEGREVTVQGQSRQIRTAGIDIVVRGPDWRTEVLAVITNPNVAYVLMLIGIYGLLFEFYSPGLVGPGVIGAICLLLAFYAFHVLPVNYTGFAMLLLGVGLVVAETVTPSFGVLGLGGIASFVIGSIMLMDTDVPGFMVARELVASIALVAALLLLALLTVLMRSRRRQVVSGIEEMIDSTGAVLEWANGTGRVRIHGEVWQARSEQSPATGTKVRVVALDGLTLIVTPE
ncbi:MAG: nodulation protein NfeD [Rhodospirillales bacterium]|nr:nodulation protein NfeD [Rhodospirillales bacterium]